ncbi:TetR/AcrR family transcriptional regulator [Paralcaligenes ureilyticus]|nr:TetR/AcrR family transcriptional regulator [Paralcaligenes ureilyticus]
MKENNVDEATQMDASRQADSTRSFASGVRPAQQARSKATLLALLEAGRESLEEGTLEELKISEVASRAGTSVGAFYGRFENKEVFFYAIQEKILSELGVQLDEMFARLQKTQADAYQYINTLTTFWVSIFRNNRGLYRAAFKHSSAVPGVWTPFKRLGYHGSELLVETLLPALADQGVKSDEKQIRVAMQFVNGLLVNATINDPGPVRLDDKDMQGYVSRFLCTFLGLEPPTGKRGRPGKKHKGES